MPDYSAFRAARQAKAETARVDDRLRLARVERVLATLGSQMEDLIGADAWHTVRKAIEAAITGERTAQASLRDRILAPDVVGDALLKLKLEEQRSAGRIEGLELALRVPTTYQALAEGVTAP